MSFLMTIVSWVLKTFLGGLFGKVITQAEDEGQHKIDASVVHAQTSADSADVDVQIIKDQITVKDHYHDKPVNPTDPFDNSDWNNGEKK